MARFDYNPLTNQLDLVDSPAGYINGVVDDPTLLPVTLGTPALDSVYLAKAGSGVWLINRKPAGLYCRVANNGDLDDWQYLGAFPEVNADGNWALYNSADPTKELKFDVSNVTTGTTRTLTVPDKSGTLATTDAADLTIGTLADARLSSNVPLKDASNTYTQNQTLDGTNNVAPNQTAASGASIMTRDLVQAAINDTSTIRRFTVKPNEFGWAETVTNGGGFFSTSYARGLRTNTNAAGTSLRAQASFVPRFWSAAGHTGTGATAGVDWSRRLEIRFSVEVSARSTNHKAIFRFGETRNSTTLGTNTIRGVGIIFEETTISGFVHDGTSLTTQSLVSTSSAALRHEIGIVSLGTGAVEFYVNGTLYWTSATSEGPNSWGGQEGTQLAFMCENNGETTDFSVLPHDINFVLY